jgi:hypothetical protein
MPAPKDYIKIQYPRKCNHCDYISNNPQMWHYHKQTHETMPADQLCEQGCGKPALFKNTGGRYTCCKITQHCDAYTQEHSSRIKQHWERPNAKVRKENTKKTFLQHCAGNENAIAKLKETKRRKSGLLTPEDAKNYRHYARAARQRAQIWAKENGYILGQQTYHVDHKLSILDAWNAGLSLEILNNPANLQILEAKENSSKGSRSVITVEELCALIKVFV